MTVQSEKNTLELIKIEDYSYGSISTRVKRQFNDIENEINWTKRQTIHIGVQNPSVFVALENFCPSCVKFVVK